MPLEGVVVATRFWGTSPASLDGLYDWISYCLDIYERVFIAVNVDADQSGALHALGVRYPASKAVIVLGVAPWNGFTTSLNTLLYAAAGGSGVYGFDTVDTTPCDFIVYQSIELYAPLQSIRSMLEYARGDDTLVVGAAIPDCHQFQGGKTHSITGLTSPWNTIAMWDIRALARTGFLAVSDGIAGASGPAIEEVAVINLHQSIGHAPTRAILLQLPDIQWSANELTGDRLVKHRQKMATKDPRAEKQRQLLGVAQGKVEHI